MRSRSMLAGRRALVTSGPTYEPIDPVRFIGNRSSGRQGHAIASALAREGCEVVLISGPSPLADPPDVLTIHVETAIEMLAACEAHLPVDIAVCAAAVADWRIADVAPRKMKKQGGPAPILQLIENPDILRRLAHHPAHRPALVVGFAAETDEVLENAKAKRLRKGCDWILANDVAPETAVPGVFGGERNRVDLVTPAAVEHWPIMSKTDIALRLVEKICDFFGRPAVATQA